MEQRPFAGTVQRVTVVESVPGGGARSATVYRKSGRKRVSRRLRPLERILRHVAEAQQAMASSYLDRHNDSNRRKRDGFLKDLGDNVFRAMRRGNKKLRLGNMWDDLEDEEDDELDDDYDDEDDDDDDDDDDD
jgi:hypothetical protein